MTDDRGLMTEDRCETTEGGSECISYGVTQSFVALLFGADAIQLGQSFYFNDEIRHKLRLKMEDER
jgi:hypothetical protein